MSVQHSPLRPVATRRFSDGLIGEYCVELPDGGLAVLNLDLLAGWYVRIHLSSGTAREVGVFILLRDAMTTLEREFCITGRPH